MRDDIRLDGWHLLSETGAFADAFLESVFFTGNGRMGARGYPALRLCPRPVETGLAIAGFFDVYKAGITDIVNMPTPLWETLRIDGQRPELCAGVRRDLDMSCGKLTLSYALQAAGKIVEVREERLFPMDRPALLLQRTSFRGSEGAALTLESGVELACRNQPVYDDQCKESDEQLCYVRRGRVAFPGPDRLEVELCTKTTALAAAYALSFRTGDFRSGEPFADGEVSAGLRFLASLTPGRELAVEKLCAITTSRDRDGRIAPPPRDWSFQSLEEENKRHWARLWEDSGIVVEGDDEAQTALRYIVFQLLVNCAARDDSVSIGARGLTHARYKGCYFWDTELFMLPFYLLTQPEAARSLAAFRVGTLPQARAHAARMNGAGARYPWMVSYDGTEQCETWDIGCSELHVTADVAYALGRYMELTRDKALFLAGGAALLVETARFWASRYSPAPEPGRVNLLFCKGPDEYCGITSNDLFTNMMAQHNLELAQAAARALWELDPAQYARLGLSEEELRAWARLRGAIKLPRDPETGRWRQDDTLHLLEEVEPGSLKHGDEASYHRVCYDRLQRYKVIKQANVLLLMTRLPERFSARERLEAWEDFEPICLHDSTLSFASHALFAAQNGLEDAAWRYFEKALFLDLRDAMGNTGKEGLHLAGFGETWQTVVFGFAGLRFDGGAPRLAPRLPKGWKRLAFRFRAYGRAFSAEIDTSGARVKPLEP